MAATPQILVALVDQRVAAREEYGSDWESSYAAYYTDEGHRCGELGRCVQHVKATIALDGEPAGRIELVLVDRNFRGDFHEICDAESQELVDVAIALFDRDGATPRRAARPSARGQRTPPASLTQGEHVCVSICARRGRALRR